jgi:hypothetical protein
MPSPTFTVKILSVAYDGTNTYTEMSISDGTTTMSTIRPVFEGNVSAATITAYAQAIANNRPVISAALAALVGTSVTG